MSLLEIKNVTLKFGESRILNDVSVSIGRGEMVGLIGPNGAGKSSLLKVILGLLPASGNVHYKKRDLKQMNLEERASLLSYLPQERDVAWPLSVETLVGLGCKRNAFSAPNPKDLQRVIEAMRRTDVRNLKHRLVDSLSGGERARVLMARALAQDTPVILADEPISGLDPAHQIGFMEMLEDLAKNGRTVLITMHELSLAARWCHRLVLLHQGRVVADGKPRNVLTEQFLAKVYGVSAYVSKDQNDFIVLPIKQLSKKDKAGT